MTPLVISESLQESVRAVETDFDLDVSVLKDEIRKLESMLKKIPKR